MSLFESTTTALLATTVPATEPSIKLSSAAVEVTPSNILSSAAVDVTNVSDPDVPMYNAAVLNSEVDLFASTIKPELAVVVPCA